MYGVRTISLFVTTMSSFVSASCNVGAVVAKEKDWEYSRKVNMLFCPYANVSKGEVARSQI